eukprot:219537-Ditylum_brightwellii.AAC.1
MKKIDEEKDVEGNVWNGDDEISDNNPLQDQKPAAKGEEVDFDDDVIDEENTVQGKQESTRMKIVAFSVSLIFLVAASIG